MSSSSETQESAQESTNADSLGEWPWSKKKETPKEEPKKEEKPKEEKKEEKPKEEKPKEEKPKEEKKDEKKDGDKKEEKKEEEPKKEEKPKEDKKDGDKKDEKKDGDKKEEKKDDAPEKDKDVKVKSDEEKSPKAKYGGDQGIFGGDDNLDYTNGDPYYDEDFKSLDATVDVDYASEEQKAFRSPLRIADMQSIEQNISEVATEVSTSLNGIDQQHRQPWLNKRAYHRRL